MGDKVFRKDTLSMIEIATLFVALFVFPSNTVSAGLTPYEVVGTIGPYDTNYYWILDVRVNDKVLISVNPNEDVSPGYYSDVFYPNLTRVAFISGYGTGGTAAYEFIAKVAGNYLLKISTRGDGFNYTVKCSHSMISESRVPDFSLTSSPDTLTVQIGSSNSATITVHSHMGFASDVSLSVSNAPAGVTIVLDPVLVTLPSDGQANSTMTVNAGLSAQERTTTLYVTGKSGDLSHSCSISLTVQRVENKLPSSISCYLNASQITYTQNVLISASLEPPASTGTIRIQSTKDNVTWNDLVLHVPSEGKYNFVWTPDAGTYFIRAKWSGDYNYLPSTSTAKTLIVNKKPTTLTIALSKNVADPGQYITVNTSIFPSLPRQNVLIQYSTANGSWQNLASGLTDQTGSFTYTWLPEGYGTFWIRSTWSGSSNYNGCSSKPTILIIESGHPRIPTHIEVSNTTLEVEYKENALVAYNVIDANSKVIKKGTIMLNTSSIGVFDLWIIFLGNETYKSCFYNTNYTVTKIACKIENVRIVSEYKPNLIELLLEYISGYSGEKYKMYAEWSAYVAFEVREAKSGDLIRQSSLKLDTSTIGYNQVDLTYEGDETHKAAPPISFRYRVLERVPFADLIQIMMAILIPGSITGLIWRYLWQRRKKRQEEMDQSTGSKQKTKLYQPCTAHF